MFARLVAEMGQAAAARAGVIVFDVSRHNHELGLDGHLARVASWFPGSNFREIDAQLYFAAELPSPIERSPLGPAGRHPAPPDLVTERVVGDHVR